MGKNYAGLRNFIKSKGTSDPLYKSLSSGKDSKPNKNVKSTNSLIEPGKSRFVIKGNHPEGKELLSNLFLAVKNNRWNRPLINLEKINTFSISSTSKWKVCIVWNSIYNKMIIPLQHRNIDLKDAYFKIQEFQKMCHFLYISMLLFLVYI